MNDREAVNLVMPIFAWLISQDPRALRLSPRETMEIVAAARVAYIALGGTVTPPAPTCESTARSPVGERP